MRVPGLAPGPTAGRARMTSDRAVPFPPAFRYNHTASATFQVTLEMRLGSGPAVVCYSSASGNQSPKREMKFLRNCRAGRGWQGALAVVAVCSLIFSLTTRFSVPINSQAPAVKSVSSQSGEPKRQHLDRDAVSFAPPAAICTCFKPAVLCPHVVAAEPSASSSVSRLSFHTRPPPVSSAIFS